MRACWWSALALLPAAALMPGTKAPRPPSRRRATPPGPDGARWQPPKQKKRRWTPPSKRGDKGAAPPVADAAADLAREAAGIAVGAVVADPRASLVELPRGAQLFREGEVADSAFVVLRGRVELVRARPRLTRTVRVDGRWIEQDGGDGEADGDEEGHAEPDIKE